MNINLLAGCPLTHIPFRQVKKPEIQTSTNLTHNALKIWSSGNHDLATNLINLCGDTDKFVIGIDRLVIVYKIQPYIGQR